MASQRPIFRPLAAPQRRRKHPRRHFDASPLLEKAGKPIGIHLIHIDAEGRARKDAKNRTKQSIKLTHGRGFVAIPSPPTIPNDCPPTLAEGFADAMAIAWKTSTSGCIANLTDGWGENAENRLGIFAAERGGILRIHPDRGKIAEAKVRQLAAKLSL